MNKLTKFLSICALAVFGTSMAQAHTTSIGFFSGVNPGEVTFVTGSYNHGGTPVNEGTLTLQGINGNAYARTTQAFNIAPTNTKYAGLIDGTTNFYWNRSRVLDKTLTTDPNFSGGVKWWQATTFTGLTAGDYSFTCGTTCGTTQQWNSLGSGTGVLSISGAIVQQPPSGVPEASSIMLLGLGLVGLGFSRRKKQA